VPIDRAIEDIRCDGMKHGVIAGGEQAHLDRSGSHLQFGAAGNAK
jgi:hypothetical protein